MKKLLPLLLIFAISSYSGFSQSESFASIIKNSADSLSAQLQKKEKEKSYLIMDVVVKEFGRGAILIPGTFFGKYLNERYAGSAPELKEAYSIYMESLQQYNNYKAANKAYAKLVALPSAKAEQIKTRDVKLATLHFQRYRNDTIYKNLVNKSNLYVKRYYVAVISHLYDTFKSKNEIFPVSLLGIDPFVKNITQFDASIFSMDNQIQHIKYQVRTLKQNYVITDLKNKTYSQGAFDSLYTARKKNIDRERETPAKVKELEQRLAGLTQKYSNLIFEKYIDMRVADSASIPVFSIPLAANDEYISSVDSLRTLREAFQNKDAQLTAFLKEDKEYSALFKKAENNEIGGEMFRKESVYIINQKFRNNHDYLNLRRERDRTLFRSNLAILRHLVKAYAMENSFLDHNFIGASELAQIKSLPELYLLEMEIRNIQGLIGNSWNNYYNRTYGMPYIQNMSIYSI